MKNEELKKEKDIVERTYRFALQIVRLVRSLPKEIVGYELGRQLLRSGTSIAANIEEAQGAFSKDDFIYKMQISFKEARETNLWLRLICDSEIIKDDKIKILIKESIVLKNILSSIVKSSKRKNS
ncbi:MAG TPA: four helix bundle protein [Candidatus Omnitrophica bacterium]|nr:four helix bundle protein [Candidatus Omnitrophota bacterium]